MELRLRYLVALVLGFLFTSCASTSATQPPPSLGEFIRTSIADEPFNHALWGILVEEEDGRVLYEQNADLLMMPASNRKLFIAALAANCIGVFSTIPTELWIDGVVMGETLVGDVVLKGYGDPSLGGRYESDRDERLRPFLEALQTRGIRNIGGVVADVSQFDREVIPGSWKYDNLGDYYAAPVDALVWNENVVGVVLDARDCTQMVATTDPDFVPIELRIACITPVEGGDAVEPVMRTDHRNDVLAWGLIDTRTASKTYGDLVAVENPALYAAEALHDFLQRSGISISKSPAVQIAPRQYSEKVAVIESPVMVQLLSTFLKSSQNLFGEMFFKAAARQVPASYEGARYTERLFLTNEVGLASGEFDFADGSGLSVENLVTPRAIVKMVRYMTHPQRRGLYYQLLATPGEEGTLRRRLAGLESSLRAKTGTIDSVNALSGYVIGRSGKLRYFSIIANHHIGESSEAVRIIDSIARRVADF